MEKGKDKGLARQWTDLTDKKRKGTYNPSTVQQSFVHTLCAGALATSLALEVPYFYLFFYERPDFRRFAPLTLRSSFFLCVNPSNQRLINQSLGREHT